MSSHYVPRHRGQGRLVAVVGAVRDAFRPLPAGREVSILDVMADERGSVRLPSLWSRRGRWGAVLLALGAVLALGNMLLCLARGWALSGLVFPAVAGTLIGVVLLELSPEAGIRAVRPAGGAAVEGRKAEDSEGVAA